MIDWEDKLRIHPAYISAAHLASSILIRLHDDPTLATAKSEENELSKKAKKKARKAAAAQKEADAKKAAAAASTNEDKGLEPPPPIDDDLDGSKLLAQPEPLENAHKWLAPLVALEVKDSETWLLVYDVAIRRSECDPSLLRPIEVLTYNSSLEKYLQSAQALHCAHAVDAESSGLHWRSVDFRSKCKPPCVL
jgi:N-alpha-acetyltransferase 15/16, NatA auxiliary subunit